MKLASITGLARTIDPRYPTNLALMILVVVVGTVAGLVLSAQGYEPSAAAYGAVRAGVSTFFAWALCRELDPDHEMSAFVGLGLAVLGLSLGNLPGGGLFWMLVVVRILNRSTGLTPTLLDDGLVLWLAWSSGYGLFTAAVLALDAHLGGPRKHIFFAVLAGGIGIWQAGYAGCSFQSAALTLLFALLFLPVRADCEHLTSKTDATDQPLDSRRVKAAQAVALGVGALTALFHGESGVLALQPFWAAVLGASFYRFWMIRRKRK